MKNFFTAFLFIFFVVAGKAQTYKLIVLQGQPYNELDSTDYVIPHYSPYFGNVTVKPDMFFAAFAKQYDLYDGVYTPLKQGYSYFMNSSRSMTIYAAKGDFVQRPGDTSVYSFKTHQGANRRFIQQWKNMGVKNGSSSDYINFQLCVYEYSGIIEIRFGPNSVSNGLWENGANGPTVGVLEMDETFNTIYNQLWLQGDPAGPSLVSSSGLVNLSAAPAAGTVYRFVPAYHEAVEEKKASQVQVYPNPVSDILQLSCKGDFEWTLNSADGRNVLSGSAENMAAIDLSGEAAGVYFMNVRTGNNVVVKKVVLN